MLFFLSTAMQRIAQRMSINNRVAKNVLFTKYFFFSLYINGNTNEFVVRKIMYNYFPIQRQLHYAFKLTLDKK